MTADAHANSEMNATHHPLRLEDVSWVGTGLVRPECVLATASGDLYTADWRGGVAHIRPDGSQAVYLGHPVDGEPLKPNGIALLRDGSFLLAHLGAEQGGVFRLHRDGRTVVVQRRFRGHGRRQRRSHRG